MEPKTSGALVGVLLFVLAVGGCGALAVDSYSRPSPAAAPSGAPLDQPADTSRFVTAVRSTADVPDSDDVLVGVGYSICSGVAGSGEGPTRDEFSRSSYSAAQQDAIFSASLSYLC